MQLHQAEKKKAKIKMAIQGPSGSGKTMSALLSICLQSYYQHI
jgi:Rad3-related DNA helicase